MGLSEWPDDWDDDDDDPKGEIVTVIFDDSMFVKAETDKAIGLAEEEYLSEVLLWIPKSQIAGSTPAKGSWIDSLDIPMWLAEEKELEYE